MGGTVSHPTSCVKKSKKKVIKVGPTQLHFRFGENINTLMEAKPGQKPSNMGIRTAYYHHLDEMNATANGIERLYQLAKTSADESKKHETDTLLDSLTHRVINLRQEVIILLEKSVYRVDDFVAKRKEIAEGIWIMLEELETAAGESKKSIFNLNEVRKLSKRVVAAADELNSFRHF